MREQGKTFIMKKFIITIIAALSIIISTNISNAKERPSSTDIELSMHNDDDGDQYLGIVNLCDPNGNTCHTGSAYKDSDNGRIYIKNIDGNSSTYAGMAGPFYAQKSNNSQWSYMIRFKDNWYYFSL